MSTDWQQQVDRCLVQADYVRAVALCEQAIEQTPDQKMPYWYLGMLSLLQGQEEEAQAIWFTGMAEGEPEQFQQGMLDLTTILRQEAERQEILGDRQTAWLLRQHTRELDPTDLDNLLHLLALSIQLEQFDPENLIYPAIELLQGRSLVDSTLLLEVLKQLLEQYPEHPIAAEFAEATLALAASPPAWIAMLLPQAIALATRLGNNALACRYAEMCLQLDAQHPIALISLSRFYQTAGRYAESIEIARRYEQVCQNVRQKIVANTLTLKGLISLGSAWTAAAEMQRRQITLIQSWLAEAEAPLNQMPDANILCSSLFFAPYFGDHPTETRWLQNQVAQRYQSELDQYVDRHFPDHSLRPQTGGADRKILRIGYLSRCLRQHSVGWLCRWLFHHFDRQDRFEVYVYFLQPQLEAFSEQWFAAKATQAVCVTGDAVTIAQRIRADEIDILVDLDSITTPATCEVMALKPAPIQVTWLGMDASGLPAIDYFIADPYVLPIDAQKDYAERIWRLPQTYIAVDGFEIGIPTLRRDQLEIPADAIVYFSSQSAYKRHPETARSQMQILRQVPNSYFLVKGLGDQQGIQTFFEQMAAEVGVSPERLRFLAIAPDEPTHRANLSIADVVLDTFPYNGATTTLETLWLGIPLVTRVGSQFASRNSYTMMMNLGISAGIAHTAEEYVTWGVRLGQDNALRQQVIWKLRQSRQTSPLWNGRQFARDLEQAYEQMWQRYLQGQSP
jgi:predicted O-linked N-acetylglucosamine transferase (SPINDLY family)